MLTYREVLSTLEMLKNEHLDVRTVTLGISLFDCASHEPAKFMDRMTAKIESVAQNLVRVCNEVAIRYGIPIVNKRIAVSPIAVAACPCGPDQMVEVARAMDRAAEKVGVDFIGGFSALVEKGFTKGDHALIEAIPEALATTGHVCSSVNVASTRAGINMDAVYLMGKTIKRTAALTRERDGVGCAKLCVFANIPEDVPFMAGAYLGVGEPDSVINVGVSGPGVVKKAIDRAREANPGLDLGQLSEIIKRTAFKVTKVGELIGRRVAEELGVPFGVVDLSLAPTPNVGDSVGEIFQSLGLRSIGVPGTTAALALLNDAVKKGGAFASSYVGGLSGAFIPVSEDLNIAQSARAGISFHRKARGDDQRMFRRTGHDRPGWRYFSRNPCRHNSRRDGDRGHKQEDYGRQADSGPGKKAGEKASFGGLLGEATIIPVPGMDSSAEFISLGGRIPAPTQSLTN